MSHSHTVASYCITYKGGIKQIKHLISHVDYIRLIKPMYEEIYSLELKKMYKEASDVKKEMYEMFSDAWFTDESPLFNSIALGSLILPIGVYECKLELI